MNSLKLLNQSEVKEILTMKDVLRAVEDAFGSWGRGEVQMPPKSYLIFDEQNGDLRSMPAYLPGKNAGVKIVTVHPENTSKGLPTVMALCVLNDPNTGFPVAVMDAGLLTAIRTGAAGGVASKWLAKEGSSEIGLIGSGVQAQYQIEAHLDFMDIDHIKISDPNKQATKDLSDWIKNKDSSIDISVTDIRNACDCDVLITTTPVRKPVVMDSMIVRPHTHINAIGADAEGKQEIEGNLIRRCNVIVDDWTQTSHSGEINVPCHEGWFKKDMVAGEIGTIVAESDSSFKDVLTVFDSTGLAIQDMATANIVLQKAIKEGMGIDWNPLK
tara:strand:- start:2338 stop:3318 length:981 start_codon:yes stop_codon:yes gene_type:complete